MDIPDWNEDDRLMQELAAAVRQAGLPTSRMVAAGEAAFAWRTVDAELATLADDSVPDDSVPDGSALVRSASTGSRTLVYESAHLSVELEQSRDGVVGQLLPAAAGEVSLLGPDGELGHARADELGCFDLAVPPGRLVRLHCRTPAGALVTEWFRL